jgi:hypothetical protein
VLLEINEPVVIASKSVYVLDEYHQLFNQHKIVYTVLVKDQDGKLIRVDQEVIEKLEYNEFKDSFATYDMIVKHYKAKHALALEIPVDFDASLDYVAPIEEEIE